MVAAVQLDDYRQEWGVADAVCDRCGFEWVAVYLAPAHEAGEPLECKYCKHQSGRVVNVR